MNPTKNPEVTIRKAGLADTRVIRSLLSQLGYSDLSEEEVSKNIRNHSHGAYCILVIEEKGQVIAFASLHWFDLLHWKEKMGRISSFCVDEAYRSKGIGKVLLLAAEEIFVREGCAKIEVTSNAKRTGAHRFYQSHGYLEDSKRFVKYL
ncbi:MAG: GNAT family N-acetyltransferase [Cytophagales bacterium]|nr:GNAT family N-acetyltransferase [Cytophagales bacterium]